MNGHEPVGSGYELETLLLRLRMRDSRIATGKVTKLKSFKATWL